MSLKEIHASPPRDISEGVVKDAEQALEFAKSKKLRFAESKFGELQTELSKKYEASQRQTNPLRRRLVELNGLLEGVVEETNFPFEGASNISVRYALGVARTFKSIFNKTVYQDPDMFAATGPKSLLPERLDAIEDAENYAFRADGNGLDTLKDGTIPCFRDGTLIIAGHWERRIERGNDGRTYQSDVDFVRDYPSPEDAGMSEEEYQSILDHFILEGDDARVRVQFSYDFIEYEAPEYEIVPLAKFVFYPTYAPNLKRMELYGRNYTLSPAEVKLKARRNEFYQNQVDVLFAQNNQFKKDPWSASRNFIEGLASQGDETSDKAPVELVDCVFKTDYDDDGKPEKYFVTFAPNYGKALILSIEPYELRRNVDFCVDFRFDKRDDRFLGRSLLADGQDLFELIDVLHRHRNNVRTLVTAPILIANKLAKPELDLGRRESLIKPGVTYWVDDATFDKSIKQLQLVNLDQPGNSLDEENLVTRYIELVIGPTQGLSGKETPSDPKAPMGKTLALLQLANRRIDDYIDEFRKSMPELVKLDITLRYQFGKEKLLYEAEGGAEQELILSPDLIDSVTWEAKRRSVTLSPEFAMQRAGALIQVYASLFQMIQSGDQRAQEMWKRMVLASGEPDADKLIEFGPSAPAGVGAPPGGAPPLTAPPQAGRIPPVAAPMGAMREVAGGLA